MADKQFLNLDEISQSFDIVADWGVAKWLEEPTTLEFIQIWEMLHNSAFNKEKYIQICSDALGMNDHPDIKELIDKCNVSCLKINNENVLAVKDVAVDYATWVSPTLTVFFTEALKRGEMLDKLIQNEQDFAIAAKNMDTLRISLNALEEDNKYNKALSDASEEWPNKTLERIFLDRLGVYPVDVKKILESQTRFNIYPQISWTEKNPIEKKCKLDLFSFVSCVDELLREIDYVAQRFDVDTEKQIIKETFEDFPEHFEGIALSDALAAIDSEKETLLGLSDDLKKWSEMSIEYKEVKDKEKIIAKEGYANPKRDAVRDSERVGKGAVAKPVGKKI